MNIGPTAEGLFPDESIERLRDIGDWMEIYGEAIYGAKASPFKELLWGRCTQKQLENEQTRLYLHVFDWPKDKELIVPGMNNQAKKAYLLADSKMNPLKIEHQEDALIVAVPANAPHVINSVIVLDIIGKY